MRLRLAARGSARSKLASSAGHNGRRTRPCRPLARGARYAAIRQLAKRGLAETLAVMARAERLAPNFTLGSRAGRVGTATAAEAWVTRTLPSDPITRRAIALRALMLSRAARNARAVEAVQTPTTMCDESAPSCRTPERTWNP